MRTHTHKSQQEESSTTHLQLSQGLQILNRMAKNEQKNVRIYCEFG